MGCRAGSSEPGRMTAEKHRSTRTPNAGRPTNAMLGQQLLNHAAFWPPRGRPVRRLYLSAAPGPATFRRPNTAKIVRPPPNSAALRGRTPDEQTTLQPPHQKK